MLVSDVLTKRVPTVILVSIAMAAGTMLESTIAATTGPSAQMSITSSTLMTSSTATVSSLYLGL